MDHNSLPTEHIKAMFTLMHFRFNTVKMILVHTGIYTMFLKRFSSTLIKNMSEDKSSYKIIVEKVESSLDNY